MNASSDGGGEFAAIDTIRRLLSGGLGGEAIGDDAAVLASSAPVLLFASDALVEGVHTDFSLADEADFGWKALAVNVSDIAAMGGRPSAAVVNVVAPPTFNLIRLYEGLRDAASEYACPIVGGDLSNAPVAVVSVAILGGVDGSPVMRSGAAVGDAVYVTGALGRSATGLATLRSDAHATGDNVNAYRRPQARLEEGVLAARLGATAMVDVSDGLAADLWHLSSASGVALSLDEVPVAEGATSEDALGGGEDFELAFTAPADVDVVAAFVAEGLRPPLAIGTCTAGTGVTLAGVPLPATGWQHHLSAE